MGKEGGEGGCLVADGGGAGEAFGLRDRGGGGGGVEVLGLAVAGEVVEEDAEGGVCGLEGVGEG